MKVLFVASGNHGSISPVVKAQGDSLEKAGVELDYFLIRGKGIWGYLRQVRPLKRYCNEHDYEVVHAHYSFSAYVASLAGIGPLIVSLMGSDTKASIGKRILIHLIARFFRWSVIIVKSEDMAKDLNLGQKVRIIPNGVDISLFDSMDRDDCRKHLDWNNDVKHILFPANPDRQEKDFDLASKAVEKLGSSVEMHVFKGVDHSETVYYYNACDVVLLTSKWEGSPNVIKEALACGCPIVSVDVGDVKERVRGVDGCFVVTRDASAIAAVLKRVIALNTRTNGRKAIERDGLSSEQVANKLLTIYKKISK